MAEHFCDYDVVELAMWFSKVVEGELMMASLKYGDNNTMGDKNNSNNISSIVPSNEHNNNITTDIIINLVYG